LAVVMIFLCVPVFVNDNLVSSKNLYMRAQRT
jgi:hypothetical protein